MRSLLVDAANRAAAYREAIRDRRVFPSIEACTALDRLGGALPDEPASPAQVLALLDECGSPATVANAGGRFFGFVNGGSLPVTVAANWLATAWDQNAALGIMSPVAARLEAIALEWLVDVLRLPSGTGGALVTGATVANVTALAAARRSVLLSAGWDVEADGLMGAPPVTVVVGGEAHATLLKPLGLLGLGRKRVVVVPADAQGRMRADSLPRLSGPTIVCIQAGNVNSGAFDPADEICRWARQSGAWVHVDGAFGLWAAVAPGREALVRGFAEADSWATDGHKWLNVPYDCGVALVRDPDTLRAAMSVRAPYLVAGSDRDSMDYGPDSSRRARGVEVWAALRSLGRSGLADLVERTCRHAARFADGLRQAGFEILNDVVINQVLVSFGDVEITRRVIAGLQAEGVCWCGGTEWQGRSAMRISVSSWATTEEDVEQSLESMRRVAARAARAV
jgi:glutamate/tyrosine decarboxylase-like PLP-dependent enzyme